jgi:hypothetical protein
VPIHNDVENLCSNDSGKDNGNPEIPSVLRFYPLFRGIADTYPKPDQDAKCDEHSIGGYAEVAKMKKSGEHLFIRCRAARESQTRSHWCNFVSFALTL